MFDTRFRVALLGPGDADLLAAADPELFEHPLQPRWSAEFLADPRHHIAVALVDGRVVGSATAVHHVHPDRPPALCIVEVAVVHTHRQRGIARAMLERLLAHAATLGCTTARVGTESDNGAARALYRAVGGTLDAEPYVSYSFALPATPSAGSG